MKIYVDCSIQADKPEVTRAFIERLVAFDDLLRKNGCDVLNFASPDLPFDPHNGEIADFVRFADVVACLMDGHPSLGFSSSARAAAEKFNKPLVAFVPSDTDVSVTAEQSLQCLYKTPTFPAEFLRSLVSEAVLVNSGP